MAPPGPADRAGALGERLARFRRPVRDALVIVGVGRAIWYFLVQGIRPWEFPGVDARAYWRVDLAHPYAAASLGDVSSYLYSPAFAQALAPFGALPFPVFFALLTALSAATLLWLVRPWPWAVPILCLPIVYELCVGNIHFLLAAVAVLGFRAPGMWALPLLTKITPGVGIAWFALRREWRDLAIAVGITGVVVAVSFVLNPAAWFEWVAYLTPSSGRSEALILRVALALLLLVFGAWTGRRWLVPVAVWLALPVIYVNSWVILLAIIRLRDDVVPTGRRPVP
jgi:Glycosyltransferase family 87